MKTKSFKSVIGGILSAAVILLASCEKSTDNSAGVMFDNFLTVSQDGTSVINVDKMLQALNAEAVTSGDEMSELLKMREEEKLARDVYSYLSSVWGSQVFSRISGSENTHMTALNTLLVYYASPDTVISPAGQFANPEVQALYNNLTAQGSVSVTDAYKIGAIIEDMDIADLDEVIGNTANENLIMVYDNLQKGSRNHIRAFTRLLNTTGIVYTPTYISQEDYNLIISSSFEAGRRYRMNGTAACRYR
jgi:hypothetical protein